MLMRRVRQQLMQGDYVARNLGGEKSKVAVYMALIDQGYNGWKDNINCLQVSMIYLEHGVCEEGLQHPSLTGCVGLILLQQLVKVSILLTVSQNLQAVLMVTHKLLIDVKHGQQDIEEVR